MEVKVDCSQFMEAANEMIDQIGRTFPLIVIGRSKGTERPACWLPLCIHDTVMLSACRRRIRFE